MCYFCDIYHVRETPNRKLEKITCSKGLELLIYINLPFLIHISCFSWMFLKLWFYHMYMFLLEYLISLCMPIGEHTSMLAGTGMCVPLLAYTGSLCMPISTQSCLCPVGIHREPGHATSTHFCAMLAYTGSLGMPTSTHLCFFNLYVKHLCALLAVI